MARLAPSLRIVSCADQGLPLARKVLGWSVQEADGYENLVSPSNEDIEKLVASDPNGTLHVFSGVRWVPMIVKALARVRKRQARIAIMSEPRVREGWRGELRFLHSSLTEFGLTRRAEFILAIGRNGPPWFESVGYPPERILPFAYFVDPPNGGIHAALPDDEPARRVKLGFLGRLVEMKGVFDIVVAAATLKDACELHIAGTGADESRLKVMCAELGLAAKFHGVIPIDSVGSFLGAIDVLVLASTSKDDGWGVVVSEALMCGTAVVATDCVGASLVLDQPLAGRVVPARSPANIADAILDLRQGAAFGAAVRGERARWARSILGAQHGAAHLLNIIAWRDGFAPRPGAFHHSDRHAAGL